METETKQEMPTRTPGKYVPPTARGDARATETPSLEESTTIRVSHLPLETTEDDVRALFQPFGAVNRVSMVRALNTTVNLFFLKRTDLLGFSLHDHSQRKSSPCQTVLSRSEEHTSERQSLMP